MTQEDQNQGVLAGTAKVIGKAAGKVAKLVGVEAEPPREPKKTAAGKLPKKNKQRLPRRQKKAQKKSA